MSGGAYVADVSVTPPASGQTKQLWSPDLFNALTGVFPVPAGSRPAQIRYPVDSQGRIRFYEGCHQSSGRYWPTSDDRSASDAYSAADQLLSDLSQAAGAAYWSAAAPVSAVDGEFTNEVSTIFSFAGCTADPTPRNLVLSLCMSGSVALRAIQAQGYEDYYMRVAEESGVSAYVSIDGGVTWSSGGAAGFGITTDSYNSMSGGATSIDEPHAKTLFTADIGAALGIANPNNVRVKVSAFGKTMKGTLDYHDATHNVNAPFYLQCPADVSVFALCIEG